MNWNEQDHPRDEDGKFTFKNGGRTTSTSHMSREEIANTLFANTRDQEEEKRKKERRKNELLNILGDKATSADILYGTPETLEKKINEIGLRKKGISTGGASTVNNTGKVQNWERPVNYTKITSPYGLRYHPILKREVFHQGIDLAANANTPVKTPLEGTVISAKWEGSYGNCVRIKHTLDNGKEITTVYAHLNSFTTANGTILKAGQKIKKGEQIGKVGSTGKDRKGNPTSTGNHLHFEVRYEGKAQNPNDYIKFLQ